MQALGALRWTAPRSYHRSFAFHRHLSSSLQSPNLILRSSSPQISPCILLVQRRHLSLGSIFSRTKPTPTPSAFTVATIARVETDANVSPHDVSKQLSLFQALVDTNVKPGYDIVIARWERMCEFVRDCAL
jgi:ATP-dependent metalloprotease